MIDFFASKYLSSPNKGSAHFAKLDTEDDCNSLASTSVRTTRTEAASSCTEAASPLDAPSIHSTDTTSLSSVNPPSLASAQSSPVALLTCPSGDLSSKEDEPEPRRHSEGAMLSESSAANTKNMSAFGRIDDSSWTTFDEDGSSSTFLATPQSMNSTTQRKLGQKGLLDAPVLCKNNEDTRRSNPAGKLESPDDPFWSTQFHVDPSSSPARENNQQNSNHSRRNHMSKSRSTKSITISRSRSPREGMSKSRSSRHLETRRDDHFSSRRSSMGKSSSSRRLEPDDTRPRMSKRSSQRHVASPSKRQSSQRHLMNKQSSNRHLSPNKQSPRHVSSKQASQRRLSSSPSKSRYTPPAPLTSTRNPSPCKSSSSNRRQASQRRLVVGSSSTAVSSKRPSSSPSKRRSNNKAIESDGSSHTNTGSGGSDRAEHRGSPMRRRENRRSSPRRMRQSFRSNGSS